MREELTRAVVVVRREIWTGSQCDPLFVPAQHDVNLVDAASAEARRRHSPPAQTFIPKGGALLRDSRGWHRGVENNSSQPRHMLTASYMAQHMPYEVGTLSGSMRFSESVRGSFDRAWWPAGAFEAIHGEESLVSFGTAVEFLPGVVDHYGNRPGDTGESDRFRFWLIKSTGTLAPLTWTAWY